MLRGTAQNPDVFFQAREATNPFYRACPTIVQNVMDRFAAADRPQLSPVRLRGRTGCRARHRADGLRRRSRRGSGRASERATERKSASLKVRLFRPFDAAGVSRRACRKRRARSPCSTAPRSPAARASRCIIDVVTALCRIDGVRSDRRVPRVIGGRYGLSSKEFTPAMVKAVFDELKKAAPKNHFTVGIHDDVTHTSLAYDPQFSTEDPRTVRALFYWLGLGRHGGREQELDQDHRREHRQLRAGLFRLRFEEIRLGDRLAPALRAATRSARPT